MRGLNQRSLKRTNRSKSYRKSLNPKDLNPTPNTRNTNKNLTKIKNRTKNSLILKFPLQKIKMQRNIINQLLRMKLIGVCRQRIGLKVILIGKFCRHKVCLILMWLMRQIMNLILSIFVGSIKDICRLIWIRSNQRNKVSIVEVLLEVEGDKNQKYSTISIQMEIKIPEKFYIKHANKFLLSSAERRKLKISLKECNMMQIRGNLEIKQLIHYKKIS